MWVDKNESINSKKLADRTNKNKFIMMHNNVTYDLTDLKTVICDISANSVDRDNALKRLKIIEDSLTKITTNTSVQNGIVSVYNLIVNSFKLNSKDQTKDS